MKRCVIVGGAPINEYSRVASFLNEDDYYIFCDCGLNHLENLRKSLGFECMPDLIVGDFDSHEKPAAGEFPDTVELIALPREKDDTDTVYAAKVGLQKGFREFLIIGGVGARFDHSMGNVGLLLLLHKAGAEASLIDDYSVMEVVDAEPKYVEDSYSFFSLLSVFGTARGVSITGAKYSLENGEFNPEYQYGVSNEVLPGERACISVEKGELLLVKDF